MQPYQRKKELIEHNKRMLNRNPAEVEKQKMINKFIDKVKRDIDYPIDTIQNMILIKVDQIEQQFKDANFTNDKSDIRNKLIQDDLVAGLCLLNEIQNGHVEEVSDILKSDNSKHIENVARAMLTIESF